jgi:3-oxoacyl-[acyl-carrier protein] reductase
VSSISATSIYCENPLITSGLGTFYCLKHEIAIARRSQPPGLPSSAAALPDSRAPLYDAGKAVVSSLTRSTAVAVAAALRDGGEGPIIRVNAVAPGPVATRLLLECGVDADAVASGLPIGRLIEPEEVAQTILFLADNKRSSAIVGAVLAVDGGLTAAS